MSLRLRLFNAVSRLLVKPLLRRQKRPNRARRDFARTARLLFRKAPFTALLPDNTQPGTWIWSGKPRRRQVLLYLHGGGYIVGSPATHAAIVSRLCRATGLRALVPDYRLAPEHPFPAAIDDARAAWDSLIDRGYRHGDILIGGDSAGGGLALALLAELCQNGTPPRAVFAFSPWTDLTLSGASLAENAQSDAFFPVERIGELRDMIIGGAAPDNPRLSPLFADYPNCPPVFLHCSAVEILRDDTTRMAARLAEFGANVSNDVWPDPPHTWHLFDQLLPEARVALRQTAGFMLAQLPPADDS